MTSIIARLDASGWRASGFPFARLVSCMTRMLDRRPGSALFTGLLLAYTVCIVAAWDPAFEFDEEVYFDAARHLAAGSYADPANPELVAPGYPLLLTLFAPLGWPLWLMRWINAPLLACAGVLFFGVLRRYVPGRWAFGLTLAFGLHPLLLRTAPMLMTESLTVCLLAAFMAVLIEVVRREQSAWRWVAGAAALLAFIALTRSMFAYVAVAGGGMALVLAAVRRWRPACIRLLAVAAGCLAFCSPYLAYTKRLTGENFCWATNGGLHLYSITSPLPGEWGSWLPLHDVERFPEAEKYHGAFLRRVEKLPVREREAAFAAKAKEHLREHPEALVRNLAANASRLFFGFPWSYQLERMRTHLILWPHALLVTAFLVSLWPAARRLRSLPGELVVLLLFAWIYIGGSLLLPANPRYFVPAIPFLLLWTAAILHRFLEFRVTLRP